MRRKKILKNYQLLSDKSVIYVANISEDEVSSNEENELVKKLESLLKTKR